MLFSGLLKRCRILGAIPEAPQQLKPTDKALKTMSVLGTKALGFKNWQQVSCKWVHENENGRLQNIRSICFAAALILWFPSKAYWCRCFVLTELPLLGRRMKGMFFLIFSLSQKISDSQHWAYVVLLAYKPMFAEFGIYVDLSQKRWWKRASGMSGFPMKWIRSIGFIYP